MVFKLPKPKRRVNEKMTLEALHKSAETYREMYDDIRRKKDILQKQLDIAVKCLKEYANSSEWWTTENGDKCEYTTDGYEEAQEALRMIKELDK